MRRRFTQQITIEEMRDEVKSEIARRRRVYPNWIIQGKLSAETAALSVLILEALLAHLDTELKRDAPQKELFK